MDNVEAPDTLRDTLSDAFDTVTEQVADTPIEQTAPIETAQAKADRIRDETGRFAAKDEKSIDAKPEVQSAEIPVPAVAPVKPRPSSWKKDFDPHWSAFAPEVQDYILQREREYANGVSTYKQEADNARQLNEVIAPYMGVMQQNNVQPTQLIGSLLNAHQRLALGSQQEKTQAFAKLVHDYGVDPQHLFQTLSGQQPQYPQQPQYQAPQPQDIERIVESKLVQKEINNEYQRFVSEASTKYPHFEAVKETMAGLLQAELAQDYASAYEAALRHPRHADIFEAMQEQQRAQKEAQSKAKTAAVVNGARARAVSVKSSTHTGQQSNSSGKPSLRDSLGEAFDAHVSSRV
jgi:hypothetical protein